jgi:hypothetical protein
MRCAIVGSGTRKARAISAVVRPPSSRSVSATRASVDSTGWQAVKIRRSRSSPMSSARGVVQRIHEVGHDRGLQRLQVGGQFARACGPGSAAGAAGPARGSWPWSSARRRGCRQAVAGQCSSAATSASCASSSARPDVAHHARHVAMILGASMRHTALIAAWVQHALVDGAAGFLAALGALVHGFVDQQQVGHGGCGRGDAAHCSTGWAAHLRQGPGAG